MPQRRTMYRARKIARAHRAPLAGQFVREEIKHIRKGRLGARRRRQAIAIGLAKARRAGVGVQPRAGRRLVGRRIRRAGLRRRPIARALVMSRVLRRRPRKAARRIALARFAARRRSPVARRRAVIRAVRTARRYR